jgi:microcystin degradation protein MlrC
MPGGTIFLARVATLIGRVAEEQRRDEVGLDLHGALSADVLDRGEGSPVGESARADVDESRRLGQSVFEMCGRCSATR